MKLTIQLSRKVFNDKDVFQSYCGFSDMWTVRDTPETGIVLPSGVNANVFAYAAVTELMCRATKENEAFRELYNYEKGNDTSPLAHKIAIRRISVQFLDAIYERSQGP